MCRSQCDGDLNKIREPKRSAHNKWDKLQTLFSFWNFTKSMVHKRRCHLWALNNLHWLGGIRNEVSLLCKKKKHKTTITATTSIGFGFGWVYHTYVSKLNVIACSLQVFIQNYCKLMKSAVIVSGLDWFLHTCRLEWLFDKKCCPKTHWSNKDGVRKIKCNMYNLTMSRRLYHSLYSNACSYNWAILWLFGCCSFSALHNHDLHAAQIVWLCSAVCFWKRQHAYARARARENEK